MAQQPDPAQVIDARRKYVEAFNNTLIDIWKDRIRKYKAINTGDLYASLRHLQLKADPEYTSLELQHEYLEYGEYVDKGTGRETPKGNPGDIGRNKVRQRRPWLFRPYMRSFYNIRDFMAESLGEQAAATICSLLSNTNISY